MLNFPGSEAIKQNEGKVEVIKKLFHHTDASVYAVEYVLQMSLTRNYYPCASTQRKLTKALMNYSTCDSDIMWSAYFTIFTDLKPIIIYLLQYSMKAYQTRLEVTTQLQFANPEEEQCDT